MFSATLIILLGASGDLAQKKILPALYQLIATHNIAMPIIWGLGLSRTDAQSILDASQPFMQSVDPQLYEKLLNSFTYYSLSEHSFDVLREPWQALNRKQTVLNCLVYCALASEHYEYSLRALHALGIIQRSNLYSAGWCRVVLEKPFGHDQLSAHALNSTLHSMLDEQQLYRIDHYLGKDTIGSLVTLRFANALLEPLWNTRFIDRVHIVINQRMGVGHRAGYYDKYGILKDMVQNHLLQILSLIAMEPPSDQYNTAIQDKKVELLKRVRLQSGYLGQYQGYAQECGLEHSLTPTFAALELRIDNERWQGVPFYIQSGKMLEVSESYILISFKQAHSMYPANTLLISMYPHQSIALKMWIKKPGLKAPIESLRLIADYDEQKRLSDYAAVLLDVVHAEHLVSVRSDEIEASWALVDDIIKKNLPLYEYTPGSQGPITKESL